MTRCYGAESWAKHFCGVCHYKQLISHFSSDQQEKTILSTAALSFVTQHCGLSGKSHVTQHIMVSSCLKTTKGTKITDQWYSRICTFCLMLFDMKYLQVLCMSVEVSLLPSGIWNLLSKDLIQDQMSVCVLKSALRQRKNSAHFTPQSRSLKVNKVFLL